MLSHSPDPMPGSETAAEDSTTERLTGNGSAAASCPTPDRLQFSETVRSGAKTLWQRTALCLLVAAAYPLQACSPAVARRLGTGLGKLAYRIAGRQRKRSCANLHLAYGDAMDRPARETLTCRVFEHFGRSIVAFLRGPRLTDAGLSRLVTCEGWEHIEATRASGKGVVLFTGHIGNWEILGRWLAKIKRLPLTVVAKDPGNPGLARYMRAMREGAGFAVLSKGDSARTLLRVLRRGDAICLLADQNSADVFTPFFGVPTGTVAGPATLSLHARVDLVPIFCLQKTDGTFLVRCLPPLPVPEEDEHNRRVQTLTASLNHALETVIREFPDQWLWLHNRWKSAFDDRYIDRAWNNEAVQRQDPDRFQTARKQWLGEG